MVKSKFSVSRRGFLSNVGLGSPLLLTISKRVKAQPLPATQVNVLYQNGTFGYSEATSAPTVHGHGFVHKFVRTGTITWGYWQNNAQRVTVEFKGDANCPFVWSDGTHWTNGIATFPDSLGRQAVLKPGWAVDSNDAVKYSIIVYDSSGTPIVDDPEVIIVDG